MKKTWTEWWVEYDFIETKYGKRPNYIRGFKTEAEANEFAKGHADAVVQEVKAVQY